MDPQLIVARAFVQATSEYTPMPGDVVIVPDELRFWLTVIAARVDVARAKAVIVRMITIALGDFAICIVVFPQDKQACIKT
jgi:hypothetical protein